MLKSQGIVQDENKKSIYVTQYKHRVEVKNMFHGK